MAYDTEERTLLSYSIDRVRRECDLFYSELSAKYDARPIKPNAETGGFPGVDPLDV